jgi:antitoxin VapB
VRIPRDLELPGTEATVHKEGNRLIIEPVAKPSLRALLASWTPLAVDFPDVPDRPPEPVDI